MSLRKEGFSTCSHCGKLILSGFLTKHLETHVNDAHERELKARLNPFPCTSSLLASPERIKDASKNVGYFAREGQKFGSYPSHDGSGQDSEFPQNEH